MAFDDKNKSFSIEEYQLHNRKLQDEMRMQGVDMLLLSTPENIYYSTGYRSWYTSSLFRPVYVLVPLKGDPAIILRILEKTTVQFTSWTPNIYCWGTDSRKLGKLDISDPLDGVQKVIHDLAPSTKTIGLEVGDGLNYAWSLNLLKEVIEGIPEVSFVDGTQAIQHARMVKTPWEVDRITHVSKITEQAIIETGREIRAGITTELDISKGIASKMTQMGVDKFSYLTVTSGDEKYKTFNTYATDRVIQKGDFVLVDISGHIDGYASDLTRVFSIGKAPEFERELAELASLSVRVAKDVMRPGVLVSEINRVCEDVIRNSKYSPFVIHSSGHSIGLSVVEFPVIGNDYQIPLEPGMVFALEQGVYPYHLEQGVESIYRSFRMEDEVLITETGSEWLTGPGDPIIELEA
ncbi:MAG: Xaa-Pro peptidase family protein [Anaerolineaceae bacterium]|nr:Xaa-Pro peptidase family protein [Anaerolineaceae bacterium]